MTLSVSESNVHDLLFTLRQELFEERASLRALRRHAKARGTGSVVDGGQAGRGRYRDVLGGPELDEVGIKNMQDAIRLLCRRFTDIEDRFLVNRDVTTATREGKNTQTGRRRHSGNRRRRSSRRDDSSSPYEYEKSAFGPRKVQGPGGDDKFVDEENYIRAYGRLTIRQRFVWLRHRTEIVNLLAALSRAQTRRIARQVGEIAVSLHDYGTILLDMQTNIAAIEGRMNRVVGVRRVD